jgi:probable HAF family extracellular repeat protein
VRTFGYRMLLSLTLLLPGAGAAAGQAYTATKIDIADLFGSQEALIVNASGQVAGAFSNRSRGVVSCCQAFIWSKPAGTVLLGSLSGGQSVAVGLNDSGEIFGRPVSASTSVDAFVWFQGQDTQDLGFRVDGGGGINNLGQVVGTEEFSNAEHAFLWSQSGGTIDLGTLGGNSSSATAINSGGQVVGYADTGNPAQPVAAFLWTESTGMQPFLDSTFQSYATSINDSGQIVGLFSKDGANQNSFFWTQSAGMLDLGLAGPCCGGEVPAVNAKGQVVAMQVTGDEQFPFVWSPSAGMQDLRTLVRSNIKLTWVGSINNLGQIAAGNFSSAFLLTPKMSVALVSSMNPSVAGHGATITATVTSIAGPPPDGENVTFTSGTAVLAVVPLVSGVAVFDTTNLKAGNRRILARYPGDGTYEGCRSLVLTQVVTHD